MENLGGQLYFRAVRSEYTRDYGGFSNMLSIGLICLL